MATEKTFEFDKALKELEDITAWFESSDTDLDTGLAKFERGMELANELKTHLSGVENRIEKIKRRFADNTATPVVAAPHEPADREQPPAPHEPLGPEPTEPEESTDQAGLF